MIKYPHITYSGIKNKPWVLTKNFKIKLSNGDTAVIPKGYWTDFASIPRPLKLFFNHLGDGLSAFVLHDYLYNFRGYKLKGKSINRADVMVDRLFADKEMKYQMLKAGENRIKVFLFFVAVRVGGVFNYGTI